MSEFSIPSHLGEHGRAFFEQLRDERGLSEVKELQELLQAAELIDRAELARLDIEKNGATFRDRFDNIKPNPALETERRLRVAVEKMIRRLPDHRWAERWDEKHGDGE